jgi:hypothetical protein
MIALLLGCWRPLVVAALVAATTVVAQDDDVPPPTTELGITITFEQLTAAIQEQQDFWGPVKKHIAGDNFPGYEVAARQQAVAFLKQVHDELYERLFERDEGAALDMYDYLGMRLRKIEIYRRLRTAIGDDAAFVAIMDRWERAQRDIHALPEAERDARVQATLELLPGEMQSVGLSAEKTATAIKLWEMQAQCMKRMAHTKAGKAMLGFDREMRKAEPPLSDLLRSIANATDWALIGKQSDASIAKADFIRAWDELNQLKAKTRTAAKPAR